MGENCFLRAALNRNIYQEMRKNSGLTKRSNSVMNQSKNQQFMICYSSLQFSLSSKCQQTSSEMKDKRHDSLFTQVQFFEVWDPFCMQAR